MSKDTHDTVWAFAVPSEFLQKFKDVGNIGHWEELFNVGSLMRKIQMQLKLIQCMVSRLLR